MQKILIVATLCVGVFAPVANLLAGPPQVSVPALVILPPWLDAGLLVLASGGRVIGPETAPFARFVVSDDPGFFPRLVEAGAWWVFDGQRLASLCGANV
ncbi:hypothetical protein EYC08_02845 [Tabrizicola sp. WMC-M-20]|nr:hypothetical protein EYC08_02845 [Tabrizicola sp. WMC-M-20]